EGVADYSLKKETKPQQEGVADYSLKRNNQTSQRFIDLKKKAKGLMRKDNKDERTLDENLAEIYTPVKIQKILIKNIYNFDIFIRLSHRKVVKVTQQNIKFTPDEITKFQKRGLNYVLIPTENFSGFQELLIQGIIKKSANKKVSKTASLKGMIVVSANLDEYIKKIGINSFVIETIEKQREATINALTKETSLRDLLSEVMVGNIYLQEHGMLISCIASEICKQMGWNSEQISKKIHTVSILHDISLKDGKLSQIHDLNEPSLSPEDKKIILAHPAESSQIVARAKDLPPDVETMILQHHERPDGKGFPGKLGALSISPLTCIFILAEKIVKDIYGKKLSSDLVMKSVSTLSEEYNRGNFKNAIKAIKKSSLGKS
ncbi:MAG: hypothetical protein HN576_09645, partial [Bacteriovoracaceae bacterium]|nr:hypothetical protein [Bacteriovoracaceae bacterium]